MASEDNKIHLTLNEIVDHCYDLANKIATEADKLKSKEINLIYLKNGGTFPGEAVYLILTQMGYNVNTYSPHYGRYGNKHEGAPPQLMENGDLSDEQKIAIVKSVNTGNLTLILDELIDEGATMVKAWEDVGLYDTISGAEKYNPSKFKKFVWGAVLNRKTPYFSISKKKKIIKEKFVRFHANDPPEGWLTFPWEEESIYYKDHLDLKNLIYEKPTNISALREYISKKLVKRD